MEEYIKSVLSPKIQGDGGYVEFVSYENDILVLNFKGECSKCCILNRCVDWIKETIKKDMNMDITIEYSIIKPYFQDR